MKSDWKRAGWIVVGVAAIGIAVFFLVKLFFIGKALADDPVGTKRVMFALLAIGLTCLLGMLLVTRVELNRLKKQQNWLIDAVNWNVQRLRAHGLCQLPADQGALPATDSGTASVRWPWGTHHTETLGHLEAAARRFWILYDPDDPSTAPTNDMVIDWLVKERHASKNMAKAIATILRSDGLPTGPR